MPSTVSGQEMSKTAQNVGGVVEQAAIHSGVGLAVQKMSQDWPELGKDGGNSNSSLVGREVADDEVLTAGVHGLKILVSSDTVQHFKRRRMTTPVGTAASLTSSAAASVSADVDGNLKGKSLPKESNDQISWRSSARLADLVDSPHVNPKQIANDSSGKRNTDQRLIRKDGETMKCVTSFSCEIDSTISSPNKRKLGPPNSKDTAVLGEFSSDSLDSGEADGWVEEQRTTSHSKAVDDSHTMKKRDWLTQRSTEQSTGNAQAVQLEMLHNFLRSNIPAPHPGFVGDGKYVQSCNICGEEEDGTSSLICDSCEQVFHMACQNPRLKAVPHVDEWFCRSCKRKKAKEAKDSLSDSERGGTEPCWWNNAANIGKLDRDMLRMSNGRRVKVRVGPKFQAIVDDWDDNVGGHEADSSPTAVPFGMEVHLSDEEKWKEKEIAEYNLAHNIWPKGWIPARDLEPGVVQNWIQCRQVFYQEGEICPDGLKASCDVVCGKWRRVPIAVLPDENWECSCLLPWDPRHADCAVPQELPTLEIMELVRV